MKKVIYTKNAPEPVGPYSQAILINNFLFCSGQIGIDPNKNALESDLVSQTNRVMENIKAVLNEAGFDFNDVIKTTCFLADMNDFSTFNKIYEKYFVSSPARSCVEAKLPKGALVEVEVICAK